MDSITPTLPDNKISNKDYIAEPQSELQTPSIWIWIVMTLGVALLFSTAFLPSSFLGPFKVLCTSMYVVGPPQLWQFVLYGSILIHVLEAVFALHVARKVDPQHQALWFWQTLYLGYFSLRLLQLQEAELKKDL